MNNIKYLCIDDQQDATIDRLLQKLEEVGQVSFTRRTPEGLENQLPTIEQFVTSADGQVGLLLDLRLDMDVDSNGQRVAYRGPTLAQELRTRMAEGLLPAFPIVLWSVNTKFKQSYSGDETSHDLFDDVYGKDREVVDAPIEVAKKLESLACGYAKLAGVSRSNAISRLGLAVEEHIPVYSQFLDEYLEIVKSQAEHEVASFLLNDLVRRDGLLITEELLAARLGVDLEASGEHWETIKDAIEASRYTGPFSDGWPRWWWFRVENWWADLKESQEDLRRMTAGQRVACLNEKLGVNLIAASPIQDASGTKYFALCAGLNKPLDPIDGLRVVNRSPRTWHDIGYVSVHAALERLERARWHLDPFERDRLARIKEERS